MVTREEALAALERRISKLNSLVREEASSSAGFGAMVLILHLRSCQMLQPLVREEQLRMPEEATGMFRGCMEQIFEDVNLLAQGQEITTPRDPDTLIVLNFFASLPKR